MCSLPLEARGQVLPFTYYTPEREVNPLPSAEVHRVHQDASGAMWFAIFSSGLARYDGTELDIYDLDDGLRDLNLWDIVEDRSGRLWVSSNGGLVVSERPLADHEAGQRIRFSSRIAGTDLADVALRMNTVSAHPDGSVWVGTDGDGLLRYSHDSRGRFRADTLRRFMGDGVSVRSVLTRRDGTVWAALSDQRLLAFRSPTTFSVQITGSAGLPESSTNVLYESAEGVLFGGCADGSVWRLVENEGRPAVEVISHVLRSNISSISMDSRGALWIGSQGSGLLRLDPDGRSVLLTRENGLLSESVHHVYQDREANLWVAQTGGIAKLRRNHAAFTSYTARSYRGERPVLPAAAVSAVAADARGRTACGLWVASEGGLTCITADGQSRTFDESTGLLNNWVNAVSLASDGSVWAGTLRGISRIESTRGSGTSATRIQNTRAASIMSISAIDLPAREASSERSTTTWFPAYQSVYVRAEDRWIILREAAGLPVTIFQAAVADGEGHVWIGTRDRGVLRTSRPLTVASLISQASRLATLGRSGATESGWEVVDELFEHMENDLPSSQVDALEFVDGHVWVGTPAGIAVLDPASGAVLTVIDRQRGLAADNVTSLALAPDGETVWAGTNRGLAKIDARAREVQRTISQQDGLVNSEVWYFGSVATDEDGTVYYGTANGLTVYRPRLDLPNELPPEVQIRRASIVDEAGRSNEIAFEYAALTFSDEKRAQFRTRLVGYEDAWSEPTAERRLRYTNLPAFFFPKRYRFEVIAANESGTWSEVPASFVFRISPPWWLRWWAIAIYLLVLASGAVFVHRFQHARLVRRERELARLREAELRAVAAQANTDAAEARAQALLAENERKALALQKAQELEKAYYDLKAAQAQLVQAEKMASLGRLSAGIAHEIKNPLNFINNFSALSGELIDELRELLEGGEEQLSEDTRDEVDAILGDLQLNAQKILEHGKRTDAIVRSMLMHSRGKAGEPVSIDVNALVDEYVNLAYHGMRAQHSDFNTDLVRDFGNDVGQVVMMPQEVGRVLINLLNNAFYAVHEKKRSTPAYEPSVHVATRRAGGFVQIRVRDNGPGIPADVRERIFEPFFTTKPTGEGTGLGLSLSYDIITQGHGGRFSVDSEPGQFTEFVIELPAEAEALIESPAATPVTTYHDSHEEL